MFEFSSVVDFNPLSTNPAGLQPKNQIFGLQHDGYNPLNFNPVENFGWNWV
jgi:hypothetical protein